MVLEGRHARRPFKDHPAHDGSVTAAGRLSQQGPVGPRVAGGRQVTDPARLRQDLAPKPLLVVEAIGRLLGERVWRERGQQAQNDAGSAAP